MSKGEREGNKWMGTERGKEKEGRAEEEREER